MYNIVLAVPLIRPRKYKYIYIYAKVFVDFVHVVIKLSSEPCIIALINTSIQEL